MGMKRSSNGVAPPMSLYLIVSAKGEECVCVNKLGKLLFQEPLEGDRVYRVLLVEEIRDPRLE